MAKKTSKKAASKAPASKPAAKPAKKAPKKAAKKAASKPAKKAAPMKFDALAPIAVDTGKGASAAEIGTQLVAMFNQGQFTEIEDKFWNKKEIASIEGVGVGMAWIGVKAVRAKNEAWMADHEIHGGSAEGPYVGSTGFAVRFKMDVTTKSTGERMVMDEIGVYSIEDGKIVCEEFMYGSK
jgi:hypothetical protein